MQRITGPPGSSFTSSLFQHHVDEHARLIQNNGGLHLENIRIG